jgi:hypothetical protein
LPGHQLWLTINLGTWKSESLLHFDKSCKSVFSLLANIAQSKDPAVCQETYLEDLVQDLLKDHSEDDQSCCLEEFRACHEESSKKRR